MAEVTNYGGNSDKSKAAARNEPKIVIQKETVEQIVTTPGVQVKPSLGRRIKDQFVSDDAHGVGGYVLFEVAIPALKAFLADATNQAVERALFGSSRPSSSRSRPGGGSFTSYGNFSGVVPSASSRAAVTSSSAGRPRTAEDIGDILLATRVEADDVLERMMDMVNKYGVVSVNDLFAMIGYTGVFTNDKYGWDENIRYGKVRAVRDGYILDLPRVTQI